MLKDLILTHKNKETNSFNNEKYKLIELESKLQRTINELNSFSYAISHDLKTPIQNIKGFIYLIQKTSGNKLDEKISYYLNNINEVTVLIDKLINGLLSYSRLSRIEMHNSGVNLNSISNEIKSEFQTEITNRNIDLEIKKLPNINADPNLFRQIFTELLSNAIKYTKTNPNPRIEIGWNLENKKELVFYIKDNGVGFDMKYENKLFCIFQRLHDSDEYEGIGIGLALVRCLINRYNGRTWAESKLDLGSTFWFSLPIELLLPEDYN